MPKTTIELNPQFKHAVELMTASDRHVFVAGRAGTGKSTLLEYVRDRSRRKMAVLAPTGVAALNVRGQTIHSFFRFAPDVTVKNIPRLPKPEGQRAKLYRELEMLVIDEISMVRADLLDCIDAFLRLHGRDSSCPFGGVQMVFIGDLYQLPPVVTSDQKKAFADMYETPYFFSAAVFTGQTQGQLFGDGEPFRFELVELEKIYRQSDRSFIEILNGVRTNTVTPEQLETLNRRYDPHFEPNADDFWIYLTTTNATAARINAERLSRLKTKQYSFRANISGKVDKKAFPTDENLTVRPGAQVMMVNNDREGRWVNGTIGHVEDVRKDADTGGKVVMVRFADGAVEEIGSHTWDVYEWKFRRGEGVVAEVVGSFRQYPFRLAWAVTIHKSQGKTFDRAIVDVERGTFAPGQMYVALSRCRTLEGLSLKQKISKRHILMDWQVVRFMTDLQYARSEEAMSLDDKIAMIKRAIKSKQKLAITYLKAKDEKSRRVVIPRKIGEREYMGKTFIGVDAYCENRKESRLFRVDRILEMSVRE